MREISCQRIERNELLPLSPTNDQVVRATLKLAMNFELQRNLGVSMTNCRMSPIRAIDRANSPSQNWP
jgi:hypothetical protein